MIDGQKILDLLAKDRSLDLDFKIDIFDILIDQAI